MFSGKFFCYSLRFYCYETIIIIIVNTERIQSFIYLLEPENEYQKHPKVFKINRSLVQCL